MASLLQRVNPFPLFWEALRDALPALRELCQRLRAQLSRSRQDRKLPVRERRRAKGNCIPINEPAYKRPDPLIYSQRYLMRLGMAVTWDNPDIQLYREGVPVSSSHIDSDTEYQIVARIWNNSTDAPIVNLPVRFSNMGFGIGVEGHHIGDAYVDLGVRGGVNHPAFARVTWRTPARPGHYCLQAFLDWLDDLNPDNNLGQENTNVGVVHSPAEFTFELHNPTEEKLRYRFEVDTYQLPTRPPCRESTPPPQPFSPNDPQSHVAPDHDRRSYPLALGWDVALEPNEPELAPHADQVIRVKVTTPDHFRGRQPININAFHRYGLAGGVTLYVEGR